MFFKFYQNLLIILNLHLLFLCFIKQVKNIQNHIIYHHLKRDFNWYLYLILTFFIHIFLQFYLKFRNHATFRHFPLSLYLLYLLNYKNISKNQLLTSVKLFYNQDFYRSSHKLTLLELRKQLLKSLVLNSKHLIYNNYIKDLKYFFA